MISFSVVYVSSSKQTASNTYVRSPAPLMETINPILAHALNLLKQNNTESAEKEFARAATACCTAFGENDIVTARTVAHLARVCASRGKLDLAIPMYERILRIHEVLPVPSNSDHAMVLTELAGLRECSGSTQAAEDLRRRADVMVTEIGARLRAADDTHEAAGGLSNEQESSEGSEEDDSDEEESSGSENAEDDSKDGDP